MKLSIIAAMGRNRVIGRGMSLPWHLPADLKRFRKLTWGKPILMGRKTFESIAKPLPGRLNIVLTHQRTYARQGCMVVHTLEQAFQAAGSSEELMIIGGARLYEQTIDRAEFLYLTILDYDFRGEVTFPEIDFTHWKKIGEEVYAPDEQNVYVYRFLTFEREP
ncbi:MAG: dihydrofolate reductase [Gammaproteobacteria bacterium]|nr:dihydrofolate reductase [Gammaproteobacteria bacterium]